MLSGHVLLTLLIVCSLSIIPICNFDLTLPGHFSRILFIRIIASFDEETSPFICSPGLTSVLCDIEVFCCLCLSLVCVHVVLALFVFVYFIGHCDMYWHADNMTGQFQTITY